MIIPDDTKLRVAPGYRFQWEEAQQRHVLLFPEGMVKLNTSAAQILERCDGSRTRAEIVAAMQAAFPEADLADDVHAFLATAWERGWLAEA